MIATAAVIGGESNRVRARTRAREHGARIVIVIVTPQAASMRTGNRHTAQRYAAFLRAAGHRAAVLSCWDGRDCDALIALHARKSHDSIAAFRAAYPTRPLLLVLTGTDVYRDIRTDLAAQASIRMATLLIALQDMAPEELDPAHRARTRVVYQSAAVAQRTRPPQRTFRVIVLGHLREEKDPFRAALALAALPDALNLRVIQVGDALSPAMAGEAQSLMAADRRYRWLGGLPHARALGWLARSHLLVVSSRMEGGANVICEAARMGVPVVASRISGNIGMLGRDYAGYYPLEDERALAGLIDRARAEAAFYRALEKQTSARRSLFAPAAERRMLERVLAEAVSIAGR